MKTTYSALVLALTAIAPEVWAQPKPTPSRLSWDWLEAAYEVAYNSPYWEEAREKSVWAGRARTSIGILPNLHVTGSYDKQRFDASVAGIHTDETMYLGRYGLGTHTNFGPSSALVLEAAREEVGERSHSDDNGDNPQDDYFVARGFAYYAGLRHLMGSAEFELGYELAKLKDEIAFADGFDPVRLMLKLNTLSIQLSAPLTRRISFTMRFEQLSSTGNLDQDEINLHDESTGHFENILFGLRFSL